MIGKNLNNISPKEVHFLKEHGTTILKNGYDLIPVRAESKIPAISSWQKTKATQSLVDMWASNPSFRSVGVLTAQTPAVDIDCLDADISKRMIEFCEAKLGVAPKRVGLAPKTILVYRTETPFKKIQSPAFVDSDGRKHQVEVLGQFQQFIAFGIHPDTQKPYTWSEKSILDVPQDQLPLITKEQAQEIADYFVSIVPEDWKEDGAGTQPQTEASEGFLKNYKPPVDLKPGEIQQTLALLNPDDSYGNWIKPGMGLHHQFGGSEEGLRIWNEWSAEGSKHVQGECERKWETFIPDSDTVNPITFATVMKMAKEITIKDYQTPSRSISIDFLEVQKKLGPIDWLVKGFIERDTVGLFFGDPGSYKSFLAMDVAYHCASGKDWHGSEVTQGPVYYIAGEGHGGLARRQEAWFVNHNPDLSDLQFRYTTGAMDFHNEDTAKKVTHDIEEWAKTAGNPALIVIDTLARNFNGDENSASDMGQFINNVNEYLRVPFECVVLIVHHTGHSSKDRARGSMALKGGVDFEYRIEKSKTDLCIAKLACTKMKDAVEPEETWFEGKTIILEWPNDGDEIIDSLVFEKTAVVEQEKPLKPELNQFLELAKSLANPEGIVNRTPLREKAVADGIAKDFTQVRGYISTLIEKNLIDIIGTTQIRLLDQP
jgi:hypothetical protein